MKLFSRALALGAFGLTLLLSAHGPATAMAPGGCDPSIRGRSDNGCTHYVCYLTGEQNGMCSYGDCSTWSTC